MDTPDAMATKVRVGTIVVGLTALAGAVTAANSEAELFESCSDDLRLVSSYGPLFLVTVMMLAVVAMCVASPDWFVRVARVSLATVVIVGIFIVVDAGSHHHGKHDFDLTVGALLLLLPASLVLLDRAVDYRDATRAPPSARVVE